MRRALVACFLVAACGDNQQPIEIVVPHGAASFVGYKANGVWHDAVPTARGYRVISDGPYQFVFVCADDSGFDVEELFADPADGDQELSPTLAIEACSTVAAPAANAEVTGTVDEPGTLTLGLTHQNASSDSANWSYDIATWQSRQTFLFAPVTADIVVVRRDVDLLPGLDPQPPIDLTSEGVTLARAPLNVQGMVSGRVPTTSSWLAESDGETLYLATAVDTALLLPAAALAPGEHQFVDVDIEEETSATASEYRDHARVDAGDLTVRLQPPPTVTYAMSELGTSVAWEHEPLDAVGYELLVSAGGTPSIVHGFATATVSGSSTLDLAVDRDAPEFLDAWRPAWSHDLASSARAFQVQASRDGNCYETELLDRGRSTAYTGLASRCR